MLKKRGPSALSFILRLTITNKKEQKIETAALPLTNLLGWA